MIYRIAILTLLLSSQAYATAGSSIHATITAEPNSSTVGTSIDFDITGLLNSSYTGESLTDAWFNVDFGDGANISTTLSSLSGTSFSFDVFHTYSTAGNYTANLSGYVNAEYYTYDPIYGYVDRGYWVYQGYNSCGFFGCHWVNTSYYQSNMVWEQTGTQQALHSERLEFNDSAFVNQAAPQVNVPEPATLALMGLGFAGMAVRRRKSVQA